VSNMGSERFQTYVPMAKMKVMTPRQTLRIIFLPLVPRPAPTPPPPLPLLASDALLEDRGKEELPCCSGGRNAPPDGSMARAGSLHHLSAAGRKPPHVHTPGFRRLLLVPRPPPPGCLALRSGRSSLR
jgi:hypothetical protein